jgi:hypothetical protein
MVPVIAYLNVFYSASGAEEARSSQLFHCDADATPGQCTFRVRFCFDQLGPSSCQPDVYESFEMRKPRPEW